MPRVQTNNPLAGKRKPWQFMRKFVIGGDDPYLIRWRLISTPYFGIYLHKFLRGDADPYVHDHPWTFLSLVLRGGYSEMRRDKMTGYKDIHIVRRWNLMRRDDAHYIAELHRVPTWTLMFVGGRRRTWGFYVLDLSRTPNHTWVEFDNWEQYKEEHNG